jgi:hypothetical protein
VLAGFGIFARNQLARWCGVAVAAVNLIAALTSIEAYPFWALVIVGIDVLVIYGLAAYGDRLAHRPEPRTSRSGLDAGHRRQAALDG